LLTFVVGPRYSFLHQTCMNEITLEVRVAVSRAALVRVVLKPVSPLPRVEDLRVK
jgi:hypothetical protein